MLAGFALSVAVGFGVGGGGGGGGGGGAVTVTVTVSVVEPAELVATSEYVFVAVGDVLCDPLAATTAPSNVTCVAFDDVHVNIDDCPLWIDIGDAVRLAVGIAEGGGAVVDTTIVTSDSTLYVPSPASISYFVVRDGETIFDPFSGTCSSFISTDVAPVLVHVSVEDSPG
jgi:hypothetical protein